MSDPLLTTPDIAVTGAMLAGEKITPCFEGKAASSLSLYEAVERALCSNPQTIGAWLNIKQQAAQEGLAKGALLPAISGSVQASRSHAYSSVGDYEQFSSDSRTTVRSEALNLSWVLFDFGAKRARAESAQQLLMAAIQNHQASLLSVFAATAKDYYLALAAKSSVDSAREIQKASKTSLDAAEARYKNGIAPVSDVLQAQTQYAQSAFNLARAEGELISSQGLLAVDMGLSPETQFVLSVDDEKLEGTAFVKSVSLLLEQAKQSHPAIAAAQANLAAAKASKYAALAEDLPTLSLTGRATRTRQPVNYGPEMGQPLSTTHDRYIGLQIEIPLFSGFSSFYKVKSAMVAEDIQEQVLRAAEQQVAQNVWSSYQIFRTNTENLQNTKVILNSARLQFNAAQERYKLGVTTILELTNAQSTLSNSSQQRIRALAEWRTARLQLASHIGVLGMWAIK
ncbi:TolC family protein [Iodobacter sp.]|uniref:TolC family protein n=1 Tax=Iodobacter sp. TaxID=1915058 RepID=UPI0025DDAC5A|nr:TolC family protein [Iodobacter sp.]